MNKISINEVIEMAVQIEKSGYSYYTRALERKDLSVKAKEILVMLRDEEVKHEELFKSLRSKIEDIELESTTDWDLISSYMNAIVESRIFNTPDSAIKLARDAKNEIEIINNAINFEKDTLLYFHSISMNVTDSRTRDVLGAIIEEETRHVVKLNNLKNMLLV
ncbi:MAG: ferritin family protein [Candidatus Cloacimonetes bacterium]|nr:ferritin family protein [Candidatus Cloacimonadota bacterium]